MIILLIPVSVWQIPCAVAPNFATVVVSRCLGGLSSAGGSVTLGMGKLCLLPLYTVGGPSLLGFQSRGHVGSQRTTIRCSVRRILIRLSRYITRYKGIRLKKRIG